MSSNMKKWTIDFYLEYGVCAKMQADDEDMKKILDGNDEVIVVEGHEREIPHLRIRRDRILLIQANRNSSIVDSPRPKLVT